MSFSKPNRSVATVTSTRLDPAPVSGICVTCLDGCEGPCEIGRSALKGREMIYPQPFGLTTSGSEKDYPIDFSHFNIILNIAHIPLGIAKTAVIQSGKGIVLVEGFDKLHA